MSWSLTIERTAKAEFAAAVDAAQPDGQDRAGGLADDVATAKDLIKRLAARSNAAYLSAQCGGHCLQPGEGASSPNDIAVSVHSFDQPYQGA